MAVEAIKTCTLLPVPDELFVDAAIAAVAENPDNAPIRDLPAGLAAGPAGVARMAVLTEKRWLPGRTLRVKFVGGDPRIRERLIPFARQWEEHANLPLDFVGGDEAAEIRVAFRIGDGSWSYLGTDALVIPADRPTMNYGWLEPGGPDDEYSRVVLHEFGHALAAIHEHMHPEGGIPWDLPKVYAYYQATQGWTPAEVDRQVLFQYDRTQTNFSEYDADSIMHYPVPQGLTVGDFEVGWNRVLSPRDAEFIGTVYPFAARPEPELVPGEEVEESIGAHGEEDHFTFEVAPEPALVTLATRGGTDVVMGLYGPDDRGTLLAFDDDSGAGLNARIRRLLPAGRYWVRVRHWHPEGQGAYRLRLDLD
ncbi:MAG TPA: peptidase [Thermoanaerobaculia bacterium]|nr:peptidase [Thermoanaerobaculia bacterium]